MNVLLFIQNGTESVITRVMEAPVPEAVKSMNIWDLTLKGGLLMIPIAFFLFIAVAVLIERIFVFKKIDKEDPTFMNRIKDYIHEGKIGSAINLCQMTNTPISRMIAKGISRLGRPMNDILVAIENVGNIEVAKLEKGFTWVATAAAIAPMIGFLGTVTGMVRAFFSMASAGTNVDITTLSSGIYEALVTTVAGLIAGIIALLAYNYLVYRVTKVMNTMEARSMEFLDLLNEPTK